MRAVVCPSYGPPEIVRVEERPSPTPGPGQARVRVYAAAVNFPDVLLIANKYQISVPPPFVPGSEFAGIVTEVGPTDAAETAGVAIGDLVTSTGLVGAFAEELVTDAVKLRPVPADVEPRTAAAFGVAHRTAYHTLRSVARIREGDELIVLGGGGGVGLAAVQLAVALGASVTAVASSADKLEAAASYGARHLVDHRAGDLRAQLQAALPGGADAVVDPVGGGLSEPALRALRRGGRFVTVGYASGEIPRIPLNLVLVKGVQILGFQFQDVPPDELRRNESELTELLVAGRAVPHIGGSYGLTDAAAALRTVADGRAIGKILLDATA